MTAGFGSTYAGSVVSSRSSASRRVRAARGQEGGPGEDLLDRRPTLENGIFGVLFTLSKENSDHRVRIRWVLVKIIIDAWQLFATVITPNKQGWRFNGAAWAVVSVLNFTWLGNLGYGAYLAVLYSTVALLAVNVAMCVWVAWCFKEHKFPVVWPIKVLRVFSSVFFQVFDVASLNLLQLGISCRFTGPYRPRMHLQLFPEYSCSASPHVTHAVVSGLSLVLFVVIALLLNMAEVEVNPLSRRPLALGHSGAEVMIFALKAGLTLVDVFIGWRKVAACVYLALSLALAWQQLRWSSNLVAWMNYLKSGVSITIVWSCAMLMLLVFRPGIEAERADAWADSITIAMLAGLAPAFGAGALMSWAMIRHLTSTTLKALANAKPETPLEDVCDNLDGPRDVEIVARCCRVWVAKRTPDPEAVNKAHQVIKAGLAMFPGSAYLILLHANFMIDVLGIHQSGNRRIEDARKLNPGLMCRFVMFVRQQQATQKAAGSCANDGTNMDLLGYVEYQRKQRMVIRLHREALQAMCNFWKALDASSISFVHLSKSLGKIEASVSQAHAAYRVVLESYGNSPKLVRLYGKFLMNIKNDPWGAAEYFTEADRLDEVKDGDTRGPLLPDGTPLGRMDEMSMAVLVVNVLGEVQVANRHTHHVFGYKRGMLDGKLMSALLAPHCAQWLSTQLAELVGETGVTATVGPVDEKSAHEAVVVGMHAERVAFPLKVTLCRVSGVGDDTIIVAMLEQLPSINGVSTLWVAQNGTIAACDPQFVSTFGWLSGEVNGVGLTRLVSVAQGNCGDVASAAVKKLGGIDSDVVKRLHALAISEAKGVEEEQGLQCLVAHKYDSTPVAGIIRVVSDGARDAPVHEVRVTLGADPAQLLVVNNKGAVMHVSPNLAACLKDGTDAAKDRCQSGIFGPEGHGIKDVQSSAGKSVLATELLAGYTLSDLLPPPWNEMHIRFLKSTSALSAPSLGQWSCRKSSSLGPTMELHSASGNPVYKHVAVTSSNMAGELTHIVRMESSSLETALDERRLRLNVSEDGRITGVSSGTPSNLFGQDPIQLAGRGLWEVIEEPASMEGGGATSYTQGAQMLNSLIDRALAYPEHSWRVRVQQPPKLSRGNAVGLAAAARVTMAKPAIMQVHVEVASDNAAVNQAPAIVLDLWPTTSITGVLELDTAGRVTAVLEERMRPAGLLFGLPCQSLIGASLEVLIALPAGRTSPRDLLSLHGAKKSSMKVNKEATFKVGPVHVLQGMHSDGRPLPLDVQIVGRPGPNQAVTAILRPHVAPMLPTAKQPAVGAAAVAQSRPGAFVGSRTAGILQRNPSTAGMAGPFVMAAKATLPSPVKHPKYAAPEFALALEPSTKQPKQPPPSPSAGPPATPPSHPSLHLGGHSNRRSDDVEVFATHPAVPDLLASGVGDALPVPGVTPGKAATLAGRSKLADLVKAVDGERSNSLPSPAVEGARSRRLGSSTLMAALPEGQVLGHNVPSAYATEEPTLPGATPRTGQGFSVVPEPNSTDAQQYADGGSVAGSGLHVVNRKASVVVERTERISTWVTSNGAFYQNSACAATGKEEDTLSTRSDELLPDHGFSQLAAIIRGSSVVQPETVMPEVRGSPSVLRGESRGASRGEQEGYCVDDDAASEGGQSAVSAQSAGGGAEYKRGKRFRKLAKTMDSSQAQQVQSRFRNHALGVVALLVVVHIICFVLTVTSVESLRSSMLKLGGSGESQRFMHRIMSDTRALDVISRNKTVSNLYSPADAPAILKRIKSDAEQVKALLNEILQAHHDSDSRVMEVLYYTLWKVWNGNSADGSDTFSNVTIWDFGTTFYNMAKDVVQQYDAWSSQSIRVADTAPVQFLIKSGPDLWRASRRVLDALLFVAVDDARMVETLQLVFLAVEGAFITCLCSFYVAYLLRAVAAQRFKLYNTFLVIPVGLTRALASQNTTLLVDDEDDDDAEAEDDRAVTNEGDQEVLDTGVKAKRRATLNVAEGIGAPAANIPDGAHGARRAGHNGLPSPGGLSVRANLEAVARRSDEDKSCTTPRRFRILGCWSGLVRRLRHALVRRGGVDPFPTPLSAAAAAASSKRSLKYDSHETGLMMIPFVIWSALVITIYSTAVVKMKDVVDVVAIHSVANFLAARTSRAVFFSQELAVVEDPALLPSRRAALLTVRKVVRDAYYTLELGRNAYKAAGPDTERFPLVKNGLSHSTAKLYRTFYSSGYCHRMQEHLPCPGPEYRFYQSIWTGVDSIMQQYLTKLDTLASSNSAIPPGLSDDNFDFVWNVGYMDLTGGTVEIQIDHYESILALFQRILLLHIVLFLLLWVIVAGFLFFLLSPLLRRVTKERRRIAELMSQLPLELDVEKLVARALGTAAGTQDQQRGTGNGMAELAPGSHVADDHDSDNGANTTSKWKAIIRSASAQVSGSNMSFRRTSSLGMPPPR